ncbi:MAG: hypothetical protein HY337_09060 [Gemmatimonadetes bacterium]|nr:hypothetical protein [Gemmatimonadota bacterium]
MPLEAQGRSDWRVLAAGVVAPEMFAGVGAGGVGWGRFRGGVGANGVIGLRDGAPAVRAELWAGYHLDPARGRGPALYGGAGAALVANGASGGVSRDVAGFLTVFVGLDSRPAARHGWFLEAGVGGGGRVVVGYRFSRRRT